MDNITTLFVSKSEINTLVFQGQLALSYIADEKIRVAQERYIKQALGDDLYYHLQDAVAEESLSDEETELVDNYLKLAISYYTKYVILPDIAFKATNSGLQQLTNQFGSNATDKQRQELRDQAQTDGDTILKSAIDYIEDNIDKFTDYAPTIRKGKSIIGNVIF